MTPLQAAARFAAYSWYTNSRTAPRGVVEDEARQFAHDHWQAFLPVANQGLGQLLLRVAGPRKSREPRQTSKHQWQSNRRAAAMSA